MRELLPPRPPFPTIESYAHNRNYPFSNQILIDYKLGYWVIQIYLYLSLLQLAMKSMRNVAYSFCTDMKCCRWQLRRWQMSTRYRGLHTFSYRNGICPIAICEHCKSCGSKAWRKRRMKRPAARYLGPLLNVSRSNS